MTFSIRIGPSLFGLSFLTPCWSLRLLLSSQTLSPIVNRTHLPLYLSFMVLLAFSCVGMASSLICRISFILCSSAGVFGLVVTVGNSFGLYPIMMKNGDIFLAECSLMLCT